MSLRSIDSDDLTAFSSSSSTNIEANIALDGVGDLIKDKACFALQLAPHHGLEHSLYNSLFKAEPQPDRNLTDNMMTSTSHTNQPVWADRNSFQDLIGEASCSSQSSPSPSFQKEPCMSPSSNSNHSGTINWNTAGMASNRSSPASDIGTPNISQHSPFIGGISSPSEKQYSPSYNHESYNLPSCSNNAAKSSTRGMASTQPSYATVDTGYCPFNTVNASCFNAAINEDTVPKSDGKHISKLKHLKFRSLSNMYNKERRLPNQTNPLESSRMFTPISSHGFHTSFTCSNGNVTKTIGVGTASCVPSTGSSSPASPKAGPSDQRMSNPELKKFRYNQTALALQQSGLMKTTIKTAELLRKSKVLQRELIKLRKETSVFMHSVLNNPENQHLKELYLPKQENPPQNS